MVHAPWQGCWMQGQEKTVRKRADSNDASISKLAFTDPTSFNPKSRYSRYFKFCFTDKEDERIAPKIGKPEMVRMCLHAHPSRGSPGFGIPGGLASGPATGLGGVIPFPGLSLPSI